MSSGPSVELMTRAARFHFEFGLTHEETARQLGLSRVKVTRLLKQARQEGIVRVWVASEVGVYADLEARLRSTGWAREVIVVPTSADPEETRHYLAQEAARYLERVLRDGAVVAVGLSRTVALVAQQVDLQSRVRATFVSLAGSLPAGLGSPFESTQALATRFGATSVHLHAPLVVQDAQMARRLMADPAISTALRTAQTADLALVGAGGMERRPTFPGVELPSPAELPSLRERGAVGDIGGRFYDRQGLAVHTGTDDRLIGLDLEQFRKIPNRVVVAAGREKVEAVAAALRGSLVSTLITDHETGLAVEAWAASDPGRPAGVTTHRARTGPRRGD